MLASSLYECSNAIHTCRLSPAGSLLPRERDALQAYPARMQGMGKHTNSRPERSRCGCDSIDRGIRITLPARPVLNDRSIVHLT